MKLPSELEMYVISIFNTERDLTNIFRFREEWFLDLRTRSIYNSMIKEKTNNLDQISTKLNDKNVTDLINYIQSNIYTSSANLESFKEQMEEWYKKTKLRIDMNHFLREDFSLEEASSKLIELSEIMQLSKETNNSLDVIVPEYKEKIFNKELQEVALDTGFKKLDENLKLLPQNVSVIAAGTGIGKSTFSLALFTSLVGGNQNGVIYSLEMSKNECLNKIVSNVAGIHNQKLYSNDYIFQGEEKEKLEHILNAISIKDVYIEDTFNMTIEDIKQDLRSKKLKSNIDFAFIDHIGLVAASEFKSERRLSIGHTSRELKKIAKELNIHIFNVVQLNREAEKTKKPGIEHLAESQDIARDASNIILLERDREEESTTIAHIVKARQGKNVSIAYDIDFNISRVTEL